jgi:ABC-2 type transport system permease protein
MNNYFRPIFTLAGSMLKRFLRDKTALFFTFLFPLLFLFVFGAINRGGSDVSFKIAFIDHSNTQFAQEFSKQIKDSKVFKINKQVTSLDNAKQRMGRGEIDSIIELPQKFGQPDAKGIPHGEVVVYYEQSSPQTGQTLASVMQRTLDGINKNLTNHVDPLTVAQKPTKTANLSSFDYVFSGLLGFTILSLGIFGMANNFPVAKKAGILRRLRATPLGASQLIIGTALQYLAIGVVSLILMFLVATLVFDFSMRGNYLNLAVFMVLGIFLMFGFGLLIGGWAKDENQAAPLSQIVALPLMFLSGTFFPRFLMPDWLQHITGYLPLTPIIDGIRLITTEGKTLLQLGPELLIVGVWIIVVYAAAVKLFRWE